MNERILIVEDEEKLARFIELELTFEGYQIAKCPDGRDGLALAQEGGFDLVLLDIMLPGLNGLEVLRRLRRTSSIPVILLTARDSIMDKVTGLDGGADDYITKPFAIEELLARIRNCLRKNKGNSEEPLMFCDLSLDVQTRIATLQQETLELTKREFDLLEYFMQNQGIVLSRDMILQKVWGYEYEGETNVVDVYIRFLRSKIDDVANKKYIQTVRGVGYVLREDRLP